MPPGPPAHACAVPPQATSGPIGGKGPTRARTARASASTLSGAGRPARLRVAPHDQRVLTIVRVVAAPDAALREAVALVQLDRALVGHAHLERVAAAGVVGRDLEEPLEQRARDAAAAPLRMDGDVHDVPGVDVARDDHVADQPVAFEGAEAHRRGLRQLAREHRARPRGRIRAPLDLFDRAEVLQSEGADLDPLLARTVSLRRLDTHASGSLRPALS